MQNAQPSQSSYNYNNIERLVNRQSGIVKSKSISVQYELPQLAEGEEAAEGGPAPLTNKDIEEMVKKATNFQESGDQNLCPSGQL